MKTYGGVDVEIDIFVTSALDGKERSPGTHWTGGWTTWRGEKTCPYQDSNSDRPARIQSLYRLRYPGSQYYTSNNYVLQLNLRTTRGMYLFLKHLATLRLACDNNSTVVAK
jgi:hypothetical protein